MESRNVVIIMICLAVFSFAQYKWERVFGGNGRDQAFSVACAPDGGYIAAGLSASFPEKCYEMYLVKTDERGDSVWTRNYGTPFNDYCWSIAPAHGGGYVLLGATDSIFQTGPHDVYLVRIDEDGDSLWARVYGDTGSGAFTNDVGRKIEPTADSGYLIVGSTESYGAGLHDIYLVKINAAGDTQWTRTYGTQDYESGLSSAPAPGGGYLVAGTRQEGGLGQQVWLLRIGPGGDTAWTRTYGGAANENVSGVLPTGDLGFVFAGSSGDDLYLVKVDSLGEVLWSRTYGGPYPDWGSALAGTDDGCLIVVGGMRTSPDPEDCAAWLLKVDQNGDTLWTRSKTSVIGSANGMDVRQAADGGYIIAAITWSYQGDDNFFLVKTDPEGLTVSEGTACRGRAARGRAPSVYPNPFTCFATVRGHETMMYDVYDSAGRLVRACPGARIGADLECGAYFAAPRDQSHGPVMIVKVK